MNLFTDFVHTFYYSSLMCCSMASIFFFRKSGQAFKYIILLISLTLVSELIAKFVVYSLQITNNVVYHFFTPLEYLLYTLIYTSLYVKRKVRIIMVVSLAFLIVAEIVNSIYFQKYWETNTNIMILESLLLVFFSLLYFAQLMESPEYGKIRTEAVFIFNSGVLLYYAFNILVWGFHNIKVYNLINPPTLIYQINLLFSGLLYIAFTLAISINVKRIQTYEK